MENLTLTELLVVVSFYALIAFSAVSIFLFVLLGLREWKLIVRNLIIAYFLVMVITLLAHMVSPDDLFP